MKLEKNMYVRTKNGLIAKYIGYEKSEDDINFSKYNFDGKIYWYYEYYNDYVYEENFKEWFEKRVVKASHNIIDLIEVGDYVNGERVEEIWKKVVLVGQECRPISFNNIKSIVTHEQIEQIAYKVGD